jgi:AhpD family alkylhydroperoxidase
MDERMKELIAVGASVAASCQPCLEYHVGKALEIGIGRDEIAEAADVAKAVRTGAANNMDKHAFNVIQKRLPSASPQTEPCNCC